MQKRAFKTQFFIVLLAWTALLLTTFLMHMNHEKNNYYTEALLTAKSSFNKDITYRRWNAAHGGVYVPVTDSTQPNPYLKHIAHRDIETTDGKKLTLMNPAWMTREAHAIGKQAYGFQGHITSLKPVRPENAADKWETEALKEFERGKLETHSVSLVDGHKHLRYMHALITEKKCLKCHAHQGYKLGDIRGGISISVPFKHYEELMTSHISESITNYGLIYLVGLLGIAVAAKSLARSYESEQKRELEIQKKKAQSDHMASLGLLAGGVAHDLNNIIGPLVSLPKMAKDIIDNISSADSDELDDAKEALSIISDSATRAKKVVQDLVYIGHQSNLELLNKDINSVLRQFLISPECEALHDDYPNTEIVLNTATSELFADISESHIQRILLNLIINACDAITEEGIITINSTLQTFDKPQDLLETIPAGKFVRVSIEDNGLGIPPDKITKIFEPFYTGKKQSTRSGSGLGLPVVMGIIKNHNGYLNLTSSPGKGSLFEIYLPFKKAERTVPIEETKSVLSGTGQKILVVDDEPGQTNSLRLLLKKHGYSPTTMSSGVEAIEEFKRAIDNNEKAPYDLLVLDMIMPEISGLDTYKEILKLYPEQKAIAASGHSDDAQFKEMMSLGAAWISKPYEAEVLLKAVKDALG